MNEILPIKQGQQNHIAYKSRKEKQHEILHLLLKFRHLTQKQIQLMLHYKARERIREALLTLTNEGYLTCTYSRSNASSPGVYFLNTKSIPYLRNNGVSEMLLKRLYYEKNHKQYFSNHAKLLADVYVSLRTFAETTQNTLRFVTNTDLFAMRYLILPHPDAYFTLETSDGTKKRYFLELFLDQLYIYKRVTQYLTYYEKNYWQFKTQTPFPEIIIICPDTFIKIRIQRKIQKKLSYDSPVFYLTTIEQVQEKGMCPEILEKVER